MADEWIAAASMHIYWSSSQLCLIACGGGGTPTGIQTASWQTVPGSPQET